MLKKVWFLCKQILFGFDKFVCAIPLEVSAKPSGKKGGGAASGGPHANG